MYYRNSSTNYLITEMSMRQGYAFGTRIRISEEIMKTSQLVSLPFLLSHISANDSALVGNTPSWKRRNI